MSEPLRTDTRTRRAALTMAAVGASLGALHAVRPAPLLGDSPLLEDAFYALAVSRHAALGHGLTVDGVTPCNGFQPLWVAANVPAYVLTHGDRVSSLRLTLALSTGVWVLFALAMARAARARVSAAQGPTARAVALALTLGSYAVFRLFHNGLETGLLLLVLAWTLQRLDSPAHRDSPVTALVLAALVYARLDTVAVLVLTTVRALFEGSRRGLRAAGPPLVAALALAPWLLRNLALDGHLMPTSGRAESVHVDVRLNAVATLASLGQWALSPLLRLPLWSPWALALGAVAGAVVGAAVVATAVRRVRALRGHGAWRAVPWGQAVLLGHGLFLVGYYTLAFGAPHFQDRYLSPVLCGFIPATAAAVARSRRAGRAGFMAGLALVNAVFLVCSWTGMGTRGGTTFNQQTAWVQAHVRPGCTVGAGQSGALGYFRDRVVNLDGKVSPAALQAVRTHTLRAYVDRAGVDVVIDWQSYVRGILGTAPHGFEPAGGAGDFHAWVRTSARACVW